MSYCGPMILAEELGRPLTFGEGESWNPKEMVQSIKKMGYNTWIETWADLDGLSELVRGPNYKVFLLWWSYMAPGESEGHWVSLLDANGMSVHINDPDLEGSRLIPRAVFEAHWFDRDDERDWPRTAVVVEMKQ